MAPFTQLADPRVDRTKRYPLLDLVFIALYAVVSGANDCVAMAKFAKTTRIWLEKYLDLPEELPSHDTFTRVFAALDGRAFVDCFVKWVEGLQEATAGKVVAIGGKTARHLGSQQGEESAACGQCLGNRQSIVPGPGNGPGEIQ